MRPTSSILEVIHAGPLVSYQDGGRPGLLRYGVPRSGPMDRFAHQGANVALHRPEASTAIEVSVGGLSVRCRAAPVTVAVCGGEFAVRHNHEQLAPWTVCTLSIGDTLAVTSGVAGSWCYLAVRGQLQALAWLGSTSTHVRSGLGGGLVRAGDVITVGSAEADAAFDGPIDYRLQTDERGRATRSEPVVLRVVRGPQTECFVPGAFEVMTHNSYALSAAYDRMGVRLVGSPIALNDVLAIPSAPIVRGSIQVSGDGTATLLFSDHQTTGGYPKIATVLSDDVDRAAQLRPGDAIRFLEVDPHTAVSVAQASAVRRAQAFASIADRAGIGTSALLGTNLIGGVWGIESSPADLA